MLPLTCKTAFSCLALAVGFLAGPQLHGQILRMPWKNETTKDIHVFLVESPGNIGHLLFCGRDDNAFGHGENLGKDDEFTLVGASVKIGTGMKMGKLIHELVIPANTVAYASYNRELGDPAKIGKIHLSFKVWATRKEEALTFTISGGRDNEGNVQAAKISMGSETPKGFVPRIQTLARPSTKGERVALTFLEPAS